MNWVHTGNWVIIFLVSNYGMFRTLPQLKYEGWQLCHGTWVTRSPLFLIMYCGRGLPQLKYLGGYSAVTGKMRF